MWNNPTLFPHAPRGVLLPSYQCSTEPQLLPKIHLSTLDHETLPLNPQPPPRSLFPPLLISFPPVLLFLYPPFFKAVQTPPFNKTVGASKMVRKERDKKKQHRMRPIERGGGGSTTVDIKSYIYLLLHLTKFSCCMGMSQGLIFSGLNKPCIQ